MRLAEGRACFVPDLIPGEVVRVAVTERHRRWARGRLVEVLQPSPDRVVPPCPLVGTCGGCRLQHVAPPRQAELKRRVVVEQLQRIGRIPDPPVAPTRPVGDRWPARYRSWARFATTPEGRLGFRRRASDRVVAVDECLLLDDRTQAAKDALGRVEPGVDVLLRTGDDGATVAVLRPDAPPEVVGPDAVTTHVAGRPLRVSATAFFQSGRAAAETLVEEVVAAAGVAAGDTVTDLFSGGGLLAAPLAATGASVTAVEADPAAAADAVVNLEGLPARVVRSRVEDVGAEVLAADVIVLDPPRAGAGAATCRRLAAAAPRRIVYVSCDPAALARDAATLGTAGYRLERAVPVDAFGHTAHVEVVATFLATAG